MDIGGSCNGCIAMVLFDRAQSVNMTSSSSFRFAEEETYMLNLKRNLQIFQLTFSFGHILFTEFVTAVVFRLFDNPWFCFQCLWHICLVMLPCLYLITISFFLSLWRYRSVNSISNCVYIKGCHVFQLLRCWKKNTIKLLWLCRQDIMFKKIVVKNLDNSFLGF